MKYLIAGLGNPGAEYENTRHNIGFLALDHLAQSKEIGFSTEKLADKAEFKFKGRQIHLIKPNTFMNLSGKAINYWLQSLKIPLENLLVIVDDVALEHGVLRLRTKGSSGGHNGLSNIEQVLNTSKYARLRFGIGNDFPKGKQIDYVLGEFNSEQEAEHPEIFKRIEEILLAFCTIGASRTMNEFN